MSLSANDNPSHYMVTMPSWHTGFRITSKQLEAGMRAYDGTWDSRFSVWEALRDAGVPVRSDDRKSTPAASVANCIIGCVAGEDAVFTPVN